MVAVEIALLPGFLKELAGVGVGLRRGSCRKEGMSGMRSKRKVAPGLGVS